MTLVKVYCPLCGYDPLLNKYGINQYSMAPHSTYRRTIAENDKGEQVIVMMLVQCPLGGLAVLTADGGAHHELSNM